MNLIRRSSRRDYLIRENKRWAARSGPVRVIKMTPEELEAVFTDNPRRRKAGEAR